MKRFIVCLVVVCIGLPAMARGNRARRLTPPVAASSVDLKATPIPYDAAAFARLLRQAQDASLQQRGPRASAVYFNAASRTVAIPAAGSVRGANNTFFRSDVTLVNWNLSDQRTQVLWSPNGSSTPQAFQMTIPGDRPPFTVTDFVGTILNQSGLGSLVFIPVLSNGNFDPNGAIDVYSRIWTNQPNATGTVSQPFPGVDLGHLFGEYEAWIMGLRVDSNYRTNFGIVNFDEVPRKFLITVFPDSAPPGALTEISVTVPAAGMIQQSVPGNFSGNQGPIGLLVEIDEDVPGDDQLWTAYAATTDNTTGDGWVSIATGIYDDELLDDIGLARSAPRP